jgi:hypothetical protein
VFHVRHKPYGLTSWPSCYFSQVHKVHINKQRKWVGELYKVWSKTEIGATSGAPDTVRGPGRSTSRTGRSRDFSESIHYNSPDCPVYHRTIRCANGATINFTNDRLQYSLTIRSQSQNAKSERIGLSGVPPDCPVPQEDKGLQQSITPNPNGRLTWHTPDNEQCSVRCTTGLSGVPIDSKVSQRLGSGWRL